MKSALKLLVFFGIGCLIGIVLVCAGIVSFTDMTWNELVQKLAKIEALEVVGIFAGMHRLYVGRFYFANCFA